MVRVAADECANLGERTISRSFRLERIVFALPLRCSRRRVVNRLAGGMRSSRWVVPGPGWEVMSFSSFMTVIAEASGSFVAFDVVVPVDSVVLLVGFC